MGSLTRESFLRVRIRAKQSAMDIAVIRCRRQTVRGSKKEATDRGDLFSAYFQRKSRSSPACWNSEEGQREFAAWQAEQAHHANNEKQEVPSGGELPAVHIAIVCGFNRKFYKQCNSQQLVCDMQFTVVANESNRELRWQGASAGAHPVFVLYLIF